MGCTPAGRRRGHRHRLSVADQDTQQLDQDALSMRDGSVQAEARSVLARVTGTPSTHAPHTSQGCRKVRGPHVHPLPVRERVIPKPGSGESSGDWGFPPQAPTPGIDMLPGLTRLNPRVHGLYALARRGMARRHLIEWRSAFPPRAGYRLTSVE
jgi:hypothetical protein